MFPERICCVALIAAGNFLSSIIVRLPMRGRCMIMLATRQFFCKQDHENNHAKKRIEATRSCGGTCATSLCSSRAQNRPRLRHTDLHLARWKSRGGKAVKGELEKLCSLDFHFKGVKERFKKLEIEQGKN